MTVMPLLRSMRRPLFTWPVMHVFLALAVAPAHDSRMRAEAFLTGSRVLAVDNLWSG